MRVVANGLWLVFLVKMRPSDAIFGLCVLFANGLRVWLQMSYVCGFKWLMRVVAIGLCFLLFAVYFCIILPMK